MKFTATVIPTATGVYGPFKDDVGTPREGRTIPFVALLSPDGGETLNATCAEGVDVSELELMKSQELSFELGKSFGKLTLRCLGAASKVRAAA